SADTSPFVLIDLVRYQSIRAAILEGKGTGNVPDRPWTLAGPAKAKGLTRSWIDAIAYATHEGVHIAIISPFEDGRVILDRYELGKKAKDAGALSLESLTPAMGDVKFRQA